MHHSTSILRRRGKAHHGAEIGGSEREVALASKTPFHATGPGDAVHVPAEFTFQGRYPRYKLESQAIVDHREAARGERKAPAVNPRDVFTCFRGKMRLPDFRGKAPSDRIELAVTQRADQVASQCDLISITSG